MGIIMYVIRVIVSQIHKISISSVQDDFYYAYVHATKGKCNVPNVNVDDMVFFTVDYRRRLASYFDSLPESLKDEFARLYDV